MFAAPPQGRCATLIVKRRSYIPPLNYDDDVKPMTWLVCVDGSKRADGAYDMASSLASTKLARHRGDVVVPVYAEDPNDIGAIPELRKRYKNLKIVEKERSQPIAQTILDWIKENDLNQGIDVSILVFATAGAGSFKRQNTRRNSLGIPAGWGSVSDYLVKNSRCTCLVLTEHFDKW